MKTIKTKNGRVRLQETLSTLEVGQSWKVPADLFSVGYLRVASSLYGRAVNKSFTVHAKSEQKPTITRTK